jgi:hypothetical protein
MSAPLTTNEPAAMPFQTGIVDLCWVRKNISIQEVANKLHLRFGTGKMLHCWHGEQHQHADRTPSVSIRRTTNTVKCFGCGTGPLSPVDLVMNVRSCTIHEAANWLKLNFPKIPRIGARKHSSKVENAEDLSGRNPLQILICSGLFAELGLPSKAICTALLVLWDARERPNSIAISFKALQRFSGVRSRSSVARALRELEDVLLISREIRPSLSFPLNQTQLIKVCPNSDEFWEFANAHAQIVRREVEFEKELRLQERKARANSFPSRAKMPRDEAA